MSCRQGREPGDGRPARCATVSPSPPARVQPGDGAWDVLGFGAVAVDDLVYVDHYPPPDSKQPVRAQRREGGGLAGTALVAAARLGAKAAYCGVLGDDELSAFTLRELEREGVDCTPVLRREGARPFHSIVIVDQSTGQRVILFSDAGVTPPAPGEIPEALIARCRVLFVDHTALEGSLHAARLARRLGIPVVADIERDTGPDLSELMSEVDHLIVGTRFAGQATGEVEPPEMVRALSAIPRACTVVTAGERGCWYREGEGEIRHTAARRVAAVDTTGCGDVFHGAYAAGIAGGEDVRTAIAMATVTAGLKAAHPGGRSGIPLRDEVERALAGNAPPKR